MTGELADCYASKLEGVTSIVEALAASSDGRQVLPFKSALFPGTAAVQPLTIGYRDQKGRDGVHYGWYADLELLPHMWHVFQGGAFEVDLVFHPIVDGAEAQSRKAQAAQCETIVREGLALAAKAAKETSQTEAS